MIAPAAFMLKVRITADCWLWTGGKQSRGYGSVGFGGKTHLAHRVAYEIWNGPIADDLVVNHICGVKACVNPRHLEAVTVAQNAEHARLTGLTPPPVLAQLNAAKTHCPQGHPYGVDTYVSPQGHRACRICKRASDRRRALKAAS